MTKQAVRMDPTTRFVRSLPGKYFMLREAALQLGVSDRTLRRLLKEHGSDLGPSKTADFGQRIYLYTRADIEKIRVHFESIRQVVSFDEQPRPTGRPPKWSDDQRKERQRLYGNNNYHRAKAEYARGAGDMAKVAKHEAKIAENDRVLEEMESK